jgi:thiol-disulfide isomerase/thioredoxin
MSVTRWSKFYFISATYFVSCFIKFLNMPSIYTSILLFFASLWSLNTIAQIESLTLLQLQTKAIQPENDTLYIVNFWATWCGPCVAELPYFEQAAKDNIAKNVKILLITLDFPSEKAKVITFVAKKKMKNEIYFLNAGDPNK